MFQISALRHDDFDELFRLDDHELAARGAKRYRADRTPGFPCRVSLKDAEPGEQVILVPYAHQSACSRAEVIDGRELELSLTRTLGNESVSYVHVHFAGPGCYACRVDRASR